MRLEAGDRIIRQLTLRYAWHFLRSQQVRFSQSRISQNAPRWLGGTEIDCFLRASSSGHQQLGSCASNGMRLTRLSNIQIASAGRIVAPLDRKARAATALLDALDARLRLGFWTRFSCVCLSAFGITARPTIPARSRQPSARHS